MQKAETNWMRRVGTGLYIGACAAIAAATSVAAWRSTGAIDWPAAAFFAFLSFTSEQFPVVLPDRTSYSIGFVFTIAAIVVAGPFAAILVVLAASVTWRDRNRPWERHLFNASQLALSAGLAGLAYQALGGPRLSAGGDVPAIALMLGLAVASATNFITNSGLVAGAIAISERRSLWRTWWSHYADLGRSYVAFALLGLLLGALYVHSPGAVLFLLMPLLVARHAFQTAIRMQGVFDDTVRSVIKALEAKDPYTRGHAGRVAELAEMTARAYGLPEDQCRKIRYAALMHDIGKLTVRSDVLQKPGKLTSDEYDHMKLHPMRGVAIVQEIDLLTDVLVGVRHHHERIDGKGYPDGLAGDDIPLFARLITVSDAFDSMTSTRVYRKAKTIEEAFEELHRWAGIMFDPSAIAALERAIARNGWTAAPEEDEDDELMEGGTDAPRAAAL